MSSKMAGRDMGQSSVQSDRPEMLLSRNTVSEASLRQRLREFGDSTDYVGPLADVFFSLAPLALGVPLTVLIARSARAKVSLARVSRPGVRDPVETKDVGTAAAEALRENHVVVLLKQRELHYDALSGLGRRTQRNQIAIRGPHPQVLRRARFWYQTKNGNDLHDDSYFTPPQRRTRHPGSVRPREAMIPRAGAMRPARHDLLRRSESNQ